MTADGRMDPSDDLGWQALQDQDSDGYWQVESAWDNVRGAFWGVYAALAVFVLYACVELFR